ncbi:GlsB/YeaQ/YmgE family stress response membrane protein [Oerskovia turbata]|uniref:GlsB/YeaQ/YmgE family stress response membrane protein n=1 Tax=Oerskovia turbata TaxID=1713 RepID=A0A4Q1KLA3_9CELL|nr:GlsB/YeaQ/YmgE family stress response membrane protein [Oerskovia turbata]RXR22765.1 GlsB/YeaQ/YmgE family stress response membrane protein [Oerskovia turbata]RXR30711.1 GlsB/YeaQ/YmgE family stress response membrane protein [Oerskovia turbata]TGJ96011.1 GlsB/YeaQ/YmgE family stress response membrane protein [Actinotalea fermentans ATCC 43279 = JCM 9966 = DSM 3133]
MGFLAFIVLGLLAGLIARAILPGKQTGSILMTILLGILGALLGGWLGSVLFSAPLEEFFSIQTWLLAIVGSVIVLGVYGAIRGRNGRTA